MSLGDNPKIAEDNMYGQEGAAAAAAALATAEAYTDGQIVLYGLTTANLITLIAALATKASPIGADVAMILDSADGHLKQASFNAIGGYVLSNLASYIAAQTNKGTPVGADEFLIVDSVTGASRYISWTQIEAELQSHFDPRWLFTSTVFETMYYAQGTKTAPVNLDQYLLFDSASGGHVKQITHSNLASSILSAANVANLIASQSSKTTPVDADEFALVDSVSGLLKYLTWGNAKATLKTYFDTLYATIGSGGTVTSVTSADTTLATVANTTTTPVITIVAAPKLQTARTIDGQSFDGTANITVIAPGTHAATSKTTPVDADEIPLVDSAASNVLKKLTWANLKATLKTYFDTLYTLTSTGIESVFFGVASKTGTLAGADEIMWFDSVTGHMRQVSLSTLQSNILTAANMDALITSLSQKSTPVDADEFIIADSVSGTSKWTSWLNIKSTLKTYFDGIYQAIGTYLTASNNLSDLSNAATARNNLHVPSSLFAQYTDATTTGTTLQSLYTNSIAANTLRNNGDAIRLRYTVKLPNPANGVASLHLYFASTVIFDSDDYSINGGTIVIAATIIRVSNTVVRCTTTLSTSSGLVADAYVEITSLNLSSNAYNADLKGVGDNTGNMTAKMGFGTYMPV